MWLAVLILAFLQGGIAWSYDLLLGDSFENKIVPKLKRGMPVELSGLYLNDADRLVCRKDLRLTYDLWDDIVKAESEKKAGRKLELGELKTYIESELSCDLAKPFRVRVLLDPAWANRVGRVLDGKISRKYQLIHIDQKGLVGRLPKDQVIIERDVH